MLNMKKDALEDIKTHSYRTNQPLRPWADPEGVFLGNTGEDPLKITKLSSKHLMLGHHRHASETPFFYGVSLAGQ